MRSGRPVLLADQTGSGKTLAYLLPLLEALVGNLSSDKTRAGCVCVLHCLLLHPFDLPLLEAPSHLFSWCFERLSYACNRGSIFLPPSPCGGGVAYRPRTARPTPEAREAVPCAPSCSAPPPSSPCRCAD